VPLQHNSKILSTSELLKLASHFRSLGVSKFRLTGGEPTLRKDYLDVVQGLKALEPTQLGMTTNAILLGSKSDRKLYDLIDAGLDSLNISLDTLDADKFETLTRRPANNLDRVLTALERASSYYAASSSRGTLKLNCVVMRGVNDTEIPDFIRLTDDVERFPNLQVRFIEYMPFSDNGWNTNKYVPYQELLSRDSVRDLNLQKIQSEDPHDTTKWYTYGNGARIGFITSMSSHFCAGCNRLRLTSDGQIKVCLFDGRQGNELSLRDALRAGLTPTQVNKLVYNAIQHKKAQLGGHANPEELMQDAGNNRPMTLIGG
jgi:molybdenum cofactor biosynthesis enzyme MoaA